MSKRTNKQNKSDRRKRDRAAAAGEWAGYQLGDAIVGGPAFNPMTGRFEFDQFGIGPSPMQIIGDPTASGEPQMREATLEDCVDDCPLCQEMRRQILAGNPPQVLAFE